MSLALAARDQAHVRAVLKWVERAQSMRGGASQAEMVADEKRQLAFIFCFKKVYWATLGLTSGGRHRLPRTALTWLRRAGHAVRDYRRIDLGALIALSTAPSEMAQLEQLLGEEPAS